MRSVWWLLKLLARTATRLRRVLGPLEENTHPTEWAAAKRSTQPTEWVMGACLDTEEPPPRANFAAWVDGSRPEEVRALTAVYASTFCGACPAGPDAPELRCSRCLHKLVRVIEERNGREVSHLAEIAELARTGRL